MTKPAPAGPPPDRSPSRDDPGTTPCPACRRPFTPIGRQAYCSTACRKTAFRRRRDVTVYECPDCGERLIGEQRCESCNTFARRVGIGGQCPHCDAPVAVQDLIDPAVITLTSR